MAFLPPYPLIKSQLKAGRVIPFFGAGASLGMRPGGFSWSGPPAAGAAVSLPTGGELAKYLADQTQFPAGEAIDLAKVAQYYHVVAGRVPLKQALHGIFDHNYPVPPLQAMLGRIPAPLLVVTTNYDDLVERAFKASGKPYDLVVHTSDARFGDRLLFGQHDAAILQDPKAAGGTAPLEDVSPNKLFVDLEKVSVIYKMHGSCNRENPDQDQFVITEDDYIEFLSRMVRGKAIPAIFAEPFRKQHFLFLGYSLSDWNLRVVLNRMGSGGWQSNVTSWAVRSGPSSLEQRFWQQRGVELYDLTIDDFLTGLGTIP